MGVKKLVFGNKSLRIACFALLFLLLLLNQSMVVYAGMYTMPELTHSDGRESPLVIASEQIHYTPYLTGSFNEEDGRQNYELFRLTDVVGLGVKRYTSPDTSYNPIETFGPSPRKIYSDWFAEMYLDLSGVQDQVSKGDLKFYVDFSALNKKVSRGENDYLVFSTIVMQMYSESVLARLHGEVSPQMKHNGWKDHVNTGWVDLPKDSEYIKLRFQSYKGDADNNDTGASNIRVYFYDSKGPAANTIEATAGFYKTGDTVKFAVVFDEAVKINGDMSAAKLTITDANGNPISLDGSGTNILKATCKGIDPADSKKVNYEFTVPDGVDLKGLNVKLPYDMNSDAAKQLFGNLTDIAGNAYAGTKVGTESSNTSAKNDLNTIIIDGKGPKIESISTDNSLEGLKVGSKFNIYIKFNEKVKWSGTAPTITMNNGAIAGGDGNVSGNGLDTIRITYVVKDTDNEINELDIKTFQSGGQWKAELAGDITDLSGNPLTDDSIPVLDTSSGKALSNNVPVDKTPPFGKIIVDNEGWAKSHTVTIQSSEVSASDTIPGSGLTPTFMYTLNGSFYKIDTISSEYKIGFSEGPAGITYTIPNIVAASNGQYYYQVEITDKAGNKTKISSDYPLKFDASFPTVEFETINDAGSTSEKLGVKITDGYSGFKTTNCLYQWVHVGEAVNDSLWNSISSSSDVKKEYYTELTLPNTMGEDNRHWLVVKAVDEAGNGWTYFSPVVGQNLSYADVKLTLPSGTDPSSYFPIFANYNTVSAEVYYQWVKVPASGPNPDAWVKEGSLPFSDGNSVGNSNYAVQRHFNNGELFNGAWVLYIETVNKNNGVTAVLGPYEYIFDNTLPSITVTGATYRPVRTTDIRITVTDSADGYDFPISGSYMWDGIVGSTDFTTKDLLLKDVSFEEGGANGGEGTAGYYLGVRVTGADEIIPVVGNSNYIKEMFYFDYDAPTGTVELVDGDVINVTDFEVIIKATDKTSGDWEEYYSYSIDESEWSGWIKLAEGSHRNSGYYNAFGAERFTLSLPNTNEGTHTVRFKFKDAAGNESEIYSQELVYDISPPKGKISYSTTSPTKGPVEVKLEQVSDNISSPDEIKVYYSKPYPGLSYTKWSEFEWVLSGNYSDSIWIADAVGNATELPISVSWIDKVGPEIKLEFISGQKSKELVITAAATDNGKDARLYYSFEPWNPDTNIADLEWKDTVCGETADEKITMEVIDGITYYTYHMYTGGLPEDSSIRYTFYAKAIDDVGNTSVDGGIDVIIDLSEPRVDNYYYTPNIPTGGPVKLVITFDEPVFLVPITGDYAMPTGFGLLNKTQTVIINENGPHPIKVVNRFGKEKVLDFINVYWIDEELKPRITYSPDGWTKENVTATVDASEKDILLYDITLPEGVTLKGTEGAVTITVDGRTVTAYKKFSCLFTENGIIDYMGYNTQTQLSGESMLIVDNIDRVAPTALLSYYASKPAGADGMIDGYVTASLYDITDNETDADSVSIISPGGAVWIFQENGSHDFILKDKAGNETIITATVNNIKKTIPDVDITPPTAELMYTVEYLGGLEEYDPTQWTNKYVHVTVIPKDESPVTITDDKGNKISNVYDFYENGEFTFYLTDAHNNTSRITATVSKIDVTPPTGYIEYVVGNFDGNTDYNAILNAEDTQSAVRSTNVYVPGLSMDASGRPYYTFTQNGSFTFYITDEAGNTASIKAVVDNIDNTAPTYSISDIPKQVTNKDVVVTIIANEPLKTADFLSGTAHDGVTVSKNVNTVQVTFSNNADVILNIADMSGNTTEIPIWVDCIDKTPPTATYTVDESRKATEGKVTVTLEDIRDNVSNRDRIRILNNNGSITRVFTDSGTFTFSLMDEAGNQLDIPITITGIDRTAPILSLSYSNKNPMKDSVIVTLTANEPITVLNNNGSTIVEFTQNGRFTFLAEDAAGNQARITAVVDNIDKTPPEITFDGDERLFYMLGSEYNLEDYHAIDNVDGDITAEVFKELNGFNINVAGDYSVTYTVSDKVGNTTTVTRYVSVIGPDSTRVFVNSNDPLQGTLLSQKAELTVDLVNAKGDWTIHWKEGKLKIGEMKSGTQQVTGNRFTVSKTGWYTILVRGQEKDYWLIHVYVLALN